MGRRGRRLSSLEGFTSATAAQQAVDAGQRACFRSGVDGRVTEGGWRPSVASKKGA